MATSTLANRNNLVRWSKINGIYKESQLPIIRVPGFTQLDFLDEWKSGVISSNVWNDVDVGNGVVIAVGNSGSLARSLDGEVFSDVSVPVTGNLESVTFGDGQWVAIASSGPANERIIRSTDNGISWQVPGSSYDLGNAGILQTQNISTQDNNMQYVDFKPDGTKMYMCGRQNNRVYEYDLSTAWDVTTATFNGQFTPSDFPSGIQFNSLGTTMILCVGNFTMVQYTLSTPWDITTASVSNTYDYSADSNIPAVTEKVSATGLHISSDGLNLYSMLGITTEDIVFKWTLSSPYDLSTISYDSNQQFSSVDFVLTGISFNPEGSLMILYGDNSSIIYELSLSTAFNINTASTTGNQLAIANGLGVQWGKNGNRLYAPTQTTITEISTETVLETNNWTQIKYIDSLSRFVAVSNNGTTRAIYSDNGINFFNGSGFGAFTYATLEFGNGLIMSTASATSDLMTSTDGENWSTLSTLPTNGYTALTFGKGLFVAISSANGTVIYSENGSTWTTSATITALNYTDIKFGQKVFVAISSDGVNRSVYSNDLVNWTFLETPESNAWNALAYGTTSQGPVFVGLSVTGTNRSMVSNEINTDTKYGNESQYDNINNVQLTMFPGETLSFYANLNTLEDNANFANWSLNLIHYDSFETAFFNVATLTKDIISGSDYRFYLDSFTIPANWENGCYRFVIVDTTQNDVLYISNAFRYSEKIKPYSKIIRYRNDKNILNFNYEGLPFFKNEFRIDLVVRNPTFAVNRVGYDLINGSFNPVRTVKGFNKEFITEAYNEFDHEAWNAATIHELEIFEDGSFKRYDRGEGQEYAIEWVSNYPLADGTIVLERRDSYSSNRNV